MKKLCNSSMYILFLVAVGLCCSVALFFLLNTVTGSTPADWALDEHATILDFLTAGVVAFAPTIACLWVGLKKEKLWILPFAGIGGGLAGFVLLAIGLLVVFCVAIILFAGILSVFEGKPQPVAKLKDGQGNITEVYL